MSAPPRDPQPVHRCACGADCEWCIGANTARAKFPRATVRPRHDSDTEHECVACFTKRAEAALAAGGPGVTLFSCNPSEVPNDAS